MTSRMFPLAAALLLGSAPAFAQGPRARYSDAPAQPSLAEDDWASNARFFAGLRTGVAIPAGAYGVAPMLSMELGVSAPKGFGFGLHLIGMMNPPEVPALNIAKAAYGLGAMADIRLYFQSVEPLTLYATLSGGFVAGPAAAATRDTPAGVNVVLPLVNPGFGARVKVTDTAYVAFEFGMAGFYIPFITISGGWEPERRARPHPVAVVYAPPPAARPMPPPPPPPAATSSQDAPVEGAVIAVPGPQE